MDLPEDIIGWLSDEAYLSLCREAVRAALDSAAKEKDAVASTRPPFGVLASKKARETFEHSMSTVLTTEAALQNRQEKIKVLESAVVARLRPALHRHLEALAPDYRQRPDVLALVDAWEVLLDDYGEQLQAFARELRQTIKIVGGPAASSPEGFEERMRTLAALQLAAGGVDASARRLDAAAGRVAAGTNPLFTSVHLVEAPVAGQEKWADRVAAQADSVLLMEVGRVEATVRELLADNLGGLHARAAATREEIEHAAGQYLQAYWNQLRAHAIAHYVEEKDVDEVIAQVTERNHTAELKRQRTRLTTDDPYMGER
jgi:hypothetical protein